MFTTLASPLAAAPAWLPLVPRSRPACQRLADRVASLEDDAEAADSLSDPADRITAATRVLNLSALLLSDTGHPRQAHELCTAQYDVFRRHTPLNDPHATWALQPLVNIARLRIRAGDGPGAHQLLATLHQAVITETPARIDGRDYHVTNLTHPDGLPALARFTWSVLLADGARALAQAGNWTEALAAARQNHGVGNRLLDGRQLAALTHISNAEYDAARTLIKQTRSAEPWEQVLAAILTGCTHLAADHPPRLSPDEVERHIATLDTDPRLHVFRTRAALLLLGLMDPQHPYACAVGSALTTDLAAIEDGYAARDLLSAGWITAYLDTPTRSRAVATLHTAGLGGTLPDENTARILDSSHRAATILDGALARLEKLPKPAK